MTGELKESPFGDKGTTEIEGKGQLWRGTRGYSDPQYFLLHHRGKLLEDDAFPSVFVEIRARTEEHARAMWNTRADLPTTDAQAMQNEKVKALVEAAKSVLREADDLDEMAIPALADLRAALAAIKETE